MAYDTKALVRICQVPVGAGDMASIYCYATADAAAVVETANYFTDVRLKKGDTINVVSDRGGTPKRKDHVVTAMSASNQATTALQTTAAG